MPLSAASGDIASDGSQHGNARPLCHDFFVFAVVATTKACALVCCMEYSMFIRPKYIRYDQCVSWTEL